MSNVRLSVIQLGVYGLSDKELTELSHELQSDGLPVEVRSCEQRSAEMNDSVRYLIQDVILPGIVVNAVWDTFKLMLKKAWQFARRKKPQATVSGWVISIQQNYSLNVMLPNKEVDLDTMLNLLPDFLLKLESDRRQLNGKMISVAFDDLEQKLLVQNH